MIAFLFNGIWSAFADAMPIVLRRMTTISGLGFGIVFLATIQFGFFIDLIRMTEVVYQIGSITLTCSSIATNCMSNIMLFWIRNWVTAFWYPNSLTVIKSQVKSEKVSKIEARVLYAAYHLKEAARFLQESEEVSAGN
jgi:hypothetical protein